MSKSWAQRVYVNGKPVSIGLGAYPVVTLQLARELAFKNRQVLVAGGDPRRQSSTAPTFEEAVERLIKTRQLDWKSGGRSAKLWRSSLQKHAMKKLGHKPVDTITVHDVLDVLKPIWSEMRPTARKVRQRISAVMNWSIGNGYRQDNPAGEAIGMVLFPQAASSTHFRSLPYDEVAIALERVCRSRAQVATVLCFEFMVLCAARSGEARTARWDDISLGEKTWAVSSLIMKSGSRHRVPLSGRAIEVLLEARDSFGLDGYIFPSKKGDPISDSTLSKLLRDLGVKAVPHGFRSSFRDWAADKTEARHEVIELSLAHVVGNKVVQAYARSDQLERRRTLLEEWAIFLNQEVEQRT